MKTILVIDDDADVRRIVTQTLSLEGYRSAEADNGLAGIEKAEKLTPDLVICDLYMPDIDGYETLRRLRHNPATSIIPFIFLTGHPEKETYRKGMELGADDFLVKPFTVAELLGAVKARLEKHRYVVRQMEEKLDTLRDNISMALPHELRTPLSGILGLSSILMEEEGELTPEDVKNTAAQIHHSGMRLLNLVEKFLFYVQLELLSKNPAKLAEIRASVWTSVQESIAHHSQKAAAKASREADLRCDAAPGLVRIPGEHLVKIIEELAQNAFKFSQPGTPVQVESELSDGVYEIRIEDRGRGMTHEQIANIGPNMQFERKFYEQQGIGLGLIIAKRVAEINEGEFTIESEPNVQTRITLRFPGKSE